MNATLLHGISRYCRAEKISSLRFEVETVCSNISDNQKYVQSFTKKSI